VELEASPVNGWEFVNWTENGVEISSNDIYNFYLTGSHTFYANFKKKSYSIVLYSDPPEGGVPYSDLVDAYGGVYEHGDEIFILAVPSPEYDFDYWEEDDGTVITSSYFLLTVTQTRVYTAYFKLKEYTIVVASNPSNGGLVDAVPSIGATAYFTLTATHYDNLTVSAIEDNPCFHFVNWTKDGVAATNALNYGFTVTGPHVLIANFERNKHNIILDASPSAGGTVYSDWSIGGGQYNCGETITIHAAAASCYHFVEWVYSSDHSIVVSTVPVFSHVVASDISLTAIFELNECIINTIATPGYAGTVEIVGTGSDSGTFLCDENLEITAAVTDACYHFVKWTKDGVTVSENPNYTFTVRESGSYYAHFELNACEVTLFAAPSTHGNTVSGGGIFLCDNEVTVTATSGRCHHFVEWQEGGVTVSGNPPATYTFTIKGNRVLTAIFAPDPFNITVAADPSDKGAVGITGTGGNTGTFLCEEPVTIWATPVDPSCYHFAYWTINGDVISGAGDTYTFLAGETCTCIAHFEPNDFDIILFVETTTPHGAVTGAGVYGCQEIITVKAIPDPCYHFVEWREFGVPIPGNPPAIYTFTVTGTRILTAVFAPDELNIQAIANPGTAGTANISVPPYLCGESVTIEATVTDPCYHFKNWTKDGAAVPGAGFSYTFTATESCIYFANFEKNEYNIVLYPSPGIGGTAGIGGTNDTSGAFDCGTEITIWAEPAPCYHFVEWQENNIPVPGAGMAYTFTVLNTHVLYAIFEPDDCPITVSASPFGKGTAYANGVAGGGIYPCKTNITLFAEETDPCYSFLNWQENGTIISTEPTCTYTVNGPADLIAYYVQKQYDIILLKTPPTGGNVFHTDLYDCGLPITVWAVANQGFHFEKWTENGLTVHTGDSYTFTVDRARVLTAHFAVNEYDITVLANPAEGGAAAIFGVPGAPPYPHGQPVTIVAAENDCWTFKNWTKNGIIVSTTNSYTFFATESCTYIANFEKTNYEIQISPMPPNWGTVGKSAPPYPPSYHCEDSVTVWAIAHYGYKFHRWTENGVAVSYDDFYKFEVRRSRILVAHFIPDTFDITLMPNPPEGGEVYGGGSYPFGDEIYIKAAPNHPCWEFVNWTEADTIYSTNAIETVEITGSRTFIANFALNHFDITVQDSPSNSGDLFINKMAINTLTGMPCGDSITLDAIAHTEYDFVKWTDNTDGTTVSTDAEYTFKLTQNSDFTAHFTLKQFEITVEANPQGGGILTGDGTYDYGETATLTATADPCYTFLSWTEGSGIYEYDPIYSFEVIRSRHLTANFELKYYEINLLASPFEGGEVLGGGNHPCGDTITIAAVADSCYTFIGWADENGNIFSENEQYTFPVSEERTFTAHFLIKFLNVTLDATPPAGGNVYGGGTNIQCGDTITVKAEENQGYQFLYWTENDDFFTDEPEFSFILKEDRHFTAVFSTDYYTITLISDPPAGGTLTGGGIHSYKTPLTITAEENHGYRFINWTKKDGETVSPNPSFPIIVETDSTFVAHFEKNNYSIKVSSNPPNAGEACCSGTHPFEEQITVKATPYDTYQFVNWTENGQPVSEKVDYDFTVTGDRDLVANFTLKKYQITVEANPPEAGEVTGGGIFEHGYPATVSATPSNTCRFVNWTENSKVVSIDTDYAFTVETSRTLIANFEKITYTVTIEINDNQYGFATGAGTYEENETATIEAFTSSCYRFANWTTTEGEIIEWINPYSFTVTQDITIIANFYALDFDTYAPTLWNNTFMLDLRRLEHEGYEILDCKWYKNGMEEPVTRTVDQFSYSAGPNKTDLLEPAPTWYMFKLTTRKYGILCSTHKTLNPNELYEEKTNCDQSALTVYPNPVLSGSPFTIDGVTANTEIHIFNQLGVNIKTAIATGNSISLTLNVPGGTYLIRTEEKWIKLVVK
jgi:hypothetical protein